ncbi:FtsK/SpoIIIE domain-containing protein [Paenibacillus cisolokensis]|uniref:FtsK/SpoIIIE domain-containing protein n=1 Tax=Paenibacillus cisolokensis TaxID=1658519 RepID=UPI003D2D1D53
MSDTAIGSAVAAPEITGVALPRKYKQKKQKRAKFYILFKERRKMILRSDRKMILSGATVMAAAAAKIIGAAASLWVARTAWKAMPEPAVRAKLRKLFRDGEIVLKRKGHKGKELRKYPVLQRVSIYSDCFQAVFSLPDGLDPAVIYKRDWLFQQVFGEHLELTGTAKTFTLTVYAVGSNPFDYDPESVSKAVEGLRLPIYVGRSRTGEEVYDMVDHPHLLIAGETGSGKSVALRSILTTLIRSTDNLQLYCADMKRSEFHVFRDVADQVVVEVPQLHTLLLKLRKELRRRGDLLDKAGLANVVDLPEAERPPFIVLAIDEVALLKKEKDLMEVIEEISAIGRALGVFLILSMQRPDADVLDGKLKNNLTVRMAFRHADEINSRITIGSGEAAEIKQSQKGRMVFKLDGWRYVQGPHLDLPRAKALLEPYKRPTAPPEPPETPEGNEEIEWGLIE